jgi:F0F1-type ATP synthase assembly protein I
MDEEGEKRSGDAKPGKEEEATQPPGEMRRNVLETVRERDRRAKARAADKQQLRKMMKLVALPLEMVAGPIGGMYLGYLLDEKLDTNPLFFILFGLLGLSASVRVVYAAVKEL